MKLSFVPALVLLAGLSLGLSMPQGSESGTRGAAVSLFRVVLPSIKAKTSIPILLPSDLPARLKAEDIHLVDGDGEANKYSISMYYEVPGVNANFVGCFAGEIAGETPETRGKEVSLARGLIGYFNPKSCGGSCAPAWIEWSQNGITYTIQLMLGKNTVAHKNRL